VTASWHAKEQYVAEIQIEFDVPAQMRDGTVLRADVYRPGGTGPWPVLLSRLPYGKQMPMVAVVLDPLTAARRGFMVVIQDTRGRFASEGEWEPWTHEESDGYDTVRWAAALPGSNGSVGMIGGLADGGYGDLPSGRFPAFARHDLPELGYERSRREPEWARACRVAGRHDEVDLPTFQVGGWYDIFAQGTLDNFTAMRRAGRSTTLIMGPWSHANQQHVVGDVNFGFGANSAFMGMRGRLHDLQLDWYQRTIGDSEALEPDMGEVLLFVMGINQWRQETEWPLSRAVDTDFHLRADGRLTLEPPSIAEQPEQFTYDPMDPVPTTGGALLMTDEFRPGPLDQTAVEAREDVLVFTTEPLAEDTEVTGRVKAVLFAATDGPSTDWVARLCDVDENGVSRNVTDGIVRVHAATPGQAAEHVVDLWSTRIVFRAGHRIRLQVTSSNFPRWDRNLNTANPRRARPRPEQPASRSSTTLPGPLASSCPWWFRADRKRRESRPIRCAGGKDAEAAALAPAGDGRHPAAGGDVLPRVPGRRRSPR
jgi:predicted acyl esterase